MAVPVVVAPFYWPLLLPFLGSKLEPADRYVIGIRRVGVFGIGPASILNPLVP